MRKVFGVLAFGLILLFSSTAAQAASIPTIDGQVAGIELCPEFICGVAIFAGAFQGQVGFFPNAKGIVWTALNHGELPTEVGAFTPIFPGGIWELKTLLRRFGGVVTGGQITYIGNNLFQVTVNLTLTTGGSGNLTASAILDHNTPIPTFGGTLQ
jgi:hypothetical protein